MHPRGTCLLRSSPRPAAATGRASTRRPPLLTTFAAIAIRSLSFVLAVTVLVHDGAAAKTKATEEKAATAQVIANTSEKAGPVPADTLPRPVAEMLDAIQTAVQSGNIEELRTAIEWNELRPVFSPGSDAAASDEELIDQLKRNSSDGEGREMLAIIADLLAAGPALQPLGRDFENNGVYVWPYLAERPIDSLTPAELVLLHRIVPAAEIAAMKTSKRWTWYRLVIGADGTWHAFMRPN